MRDYTRREWLSCHFDLRARGRGSEPRLLADRAWAALLFSLNVSFKLSYGWERSRNPTFKLVTVMHSIAFKTVFFFWLQALSNTSPLLNSLVGKLVPL